jgi:hypothetical protein
VSDHRCARCRVDVAAIGETFIVHDEVWLGVMPSRQGLLCVGCLEALLGRDLAPADFTECMSNVLGAAGSPRLRHRLGAGHLHGDDLLAWIDAAVDRVAIEQPNTADAYRLLALRLAAAADQPGEP